jgi:hypothetical protein
VTRRPFSFRRASACTSAPILRKATLDNNTDSSRRRFLAITAAASAVGAGSLAVAATPTTAHQCFAADDSELLQLEKQIFEQLEAAQAYDDEIFRLSEVWEAEFSRLENEFYTGRSALTTMERWAIIKAMPESAEHERLTKLQRPYYDAYDTFRADVFYSGTDGGGSPQQGGCPSQLYLGEDLLSDDEDTDYPLRTARNLLIEFVGGAPGEMLRNQFA